MGQIFDSVKTLELLENAVADRGATYVYPKEWRENGEPGGNCLYFTETDKPACIVGHVFDQIGITLDDIDNDNNGMPLFPASAINFVLRENSEKDIQFTPEAISLLSMAQSKQDSEESWGVAVAAAKAAKDL